MIPLHFGPSQRQLYGVLHGAATGPVHTAALLVNPWGQEAIRAHRLYRVLAERVARNGGSALRFDFFGTGESAGDDEEFSLAGAQADLQAAQETLLERTRPARVVWLGVGLGAIVALQAARVTSRPPEVLVLWDPVLDGRRYLDTLGATHRDWLQRTLGRSYAELQFISADELLGFPLTAALRCEIEAIGAGVLEQPRAQRVMVLGSVGQIDAQRCAAQWQATGNGCEWVPLATAVQWASEEAMNNALVPAEALQVVDRLLRSA